MAFLKRKNKLPAVINYGSFIFASLAIALIIMISILLMQKKASVSQTQITPPVTSVVDDEAEPSISQLPVINIPKLTSLANFYQYYDSNLDATFYIPLNWTIVNNPTAAGMYNGPMSLEQNGKCLGDGLKLFKNPSDCLNTMPYALVIESPDKQNKMTIMSAGNGFGGGCPISEFDFYRIPLTINAHNYSFELGRKKTGSAIPTWGVNDSRQTCNGSTKINETGTVSKWNSFSFMYYFADNASFITDMQILENIKFH